MYKSEAYFNELLLSYKKLKYKYLRELSKMPQGSLISQQKNNNTFFIHLLKNTDITAKYCQARKGITGNRKLINTLARKKYLENAVKLLDKDIALLKTLLDKYTAPTPDNIIAMMKGAYSLLPKESFLPKSRVLKEWSDDCYEANPYMPEELKHMTLNGFKVRSKSELYISAQLDKYDVPYRYEAKLILEGKTYYPDFTIRHPHEDYTIIWEHCGLVENNSYMNKHRRRMEIYERNGIVPWRNLIVTYDDEEGHFNASMIDAYINGMLL